jgi:hypothetical protein
MVSGKSDKGKDCDDFGDKDAFEARLAQEEVDFSKMLDLIWTL